MAPEGVERKLAAILSADVVGYSRLMAEDEAATIRTLTDYREAIAMLVRQHRGRVVDSPGDNILAEFPTALDAVQGAVEIQRVIQARNADLPAERRMEFRVGVHMGDVAIEGERLYGDGVNIAARLEDLAEPGGVCISRTVYEQVEKKLSIELEDLGERTLKNIPRPVHVYGLRLLLPGEGPETTDKALPTIDEVTVPGFGGRPAVAVLPFENLSGDPEQGYFADGLAEDLITRLSLSPGLTVIARNSSFAYKGTRTDLRQVSRELRVRYIVEGSVRAVGDRVRISAQLIDATTGGHVWAERYDRQIQDMFAVQDEITEAVAASIFPALSRSEWDRAARKPPQSLDAWGCVNRGYWHLDKIASEENTRARSLFQKAIELDPSLSGAFAGLALTHYWDIVEGWTTDPARSIEETSRLARKSVELDDKDPVAQVALGVALWLTGQRERMVAAFERSIQLNPNSAVSYGGLGTFLSFSGRPDDAIANLEKAMRLSPRDPQMYMWLAAMGWAHFSAMRYEDAASWLERSLQHRPGSHITQRALAASYAQLGRLDEAQMALREYLRFAPDESVSKVRSQIQYADSAFLDPFLDGLRKAGLKE